MTQAALHDEPTASAAAAVDPVCGMPVDPAKAAGRAEHGGRTYPFCSGHCLSEFRRDPARYVGTPARASEAAPAATQTVAAEGMRAAGRPLQTVLRRAESGQAKDPVCGMVVDKATALRTDRAGRRLCPMLAVVLAAAVLWFFGFAWWSALLAAVLLVCPVLILWGALQVALDERRSRRRPGA